MSTAHDDDAALRPSLKPIGLAVLANLLFGAALLGYPYLRGQQRAEASVRAFADFAGCLFAAEVPDEPGLALPRGERARFASLALRDPSWPGRCDRALSAVAQPPATMLFPAAKSAEEETRAAAARLERALSSPFGARVPEAPLVELGRLRAALADGLRATGSALDPLRDAVALGDADDLPTPSIVPIRVGEGPLEVALEGSVILATASGANRIGHVRIERDGAIEPLLVRRPALVSAVLGAREPPWAIWTTPDAQCGESCVQRATGVAPMRARTLTPAAWLRAHPLGPTRDALYVGPDAVFVAAIGEGGLHLRRFPRPGAAQGEPPQLAAELDVQLGAATRVRWMEGPSLVWVGEEGAGVIEVGGRPRSLDSPGPDARITTCGPWIALGGDDALHVHHRSGPSQVVALPVPDAIELVCGDGRLDVLALRADAITHIACEPECGATRPLADDVTRFDAARLGDALLVAFSGEGAVRVARVQGDDVEVHTPAACWDSGDGLCGPPTLAADAERAVLVTRRGGDLRMLESADGARWRALPGL